MQQVTEQAAAVAPVKKRGRPFGSVNKPKSAKKPKAIKPVKVQAESITAPLLIQINDMTLTVEQARVVYEGLKRLFAK